MQVQLYNKHLLVNGLIKLVCGLSCESKAAIYDYNCVEGFKKYGKVISEDYARHIKGVLVLIVENNKKLFEQTMSPDAQITNAAYYKLWTLFHDYPIDIQ